MSLLSRISKALEEGDAPAVSALTREALDSGASARDVLDRALIAGMDVVGEKFRTREIFLPDVLMAAKAMYAGLDLVKPLLSAADALAPGKIVIGTVQGDLHDIGKNLVGIMLRGAGFDVVDLGNDVAPETFVNAARESGATVIGMSALLTTTMPAMKEVIELLRRDGLDGSIRTIVGGAPVTADFAREIGATAYGYDGANAVEKVKALIGALS